MLFDLTRLPPATTAFAAQQDAPFTLGLTAPTSADTRRRWNREAITLLRECYAAKRFPEGQDRIRLGRYSGWGGIGNSINEYYTPPELAEVLWKMLSTLGLSGTRMLEPSCGTGVLLQHAPSTVRFDAIELSDESSAVTRLLFRQHRVHTSSFEAYLLAHRDVRFDAAILNPPFGPRGKTAFLDLPGISDAPTYFTLRSLDMLRSGGLAAMILPYGITTQARHAALRHAISARAEVLGIFGLPTDTFARTGASFATCDVWLLRARPEPLRNALIALGAAHFALSGYADPRFLAGEHYQRSPHSLLATPTVRTGMAGREIYARDGSLEHALRGLQQHCPEAPGDEGDPDCALATLHVRLEAHPHQLRAVRRAQRTSVALGEVRDTPDGRVISTTLGEQAVDDAQLEALHSATALEALLGTHTELLGAQLRRDANALRRTLLPLIQAYLERHGDPHHHPLLTHLAPLLPQLLSRVLRGGGLSAALLEDATPPLPPLDPTQPLAFALALLRSGRNVTPQSLKRAGLPGEEHQHLELLMLSGWCLDEGRWLPPERYYQGDADTLLRRLEQEKIRITAQQSREDTQAALRELAEREATHPPPEPQPHPILTP